MRNLQLLLRRRKIYYTEDYYMVYVYFLYEETIFLCRAIDYFFSISLPGQPPLEILFYIVLFLVQEIWRTIKTRQY